MLLSLQEKYEITEVKGILSVEQIIKCVEQIIKCVEQILINYQNEVSFCYLFGSYAKGYAKEDSDVDLCIHYSQRNGICGINKRFTRVIKQESRFN
jgi:predicted nucleotidyltransferase